MTDARIPAFGKSLFDWVIRNSVSLLAMQVVTGASILATVSFLSRGLSVPGFATYAVSQSIVTVAGFFSGCGIPVLLVRDGAGRPTTVLADTVALVKVRAVIMIALSGVVTLWLLTGSAGGEQTWLWVAAITAGVVMSADPIHLCDAAGLARLQGYAQGMRYSASALLIVVGYYAGWRGVRLAELVAMTQLGAALVYVGLQWWWLRVVISRAPASPSRGAQELLRRGFPFLTLSGASMLLERGDVAFAGFLLAPALTAEYAAAAQLVVGLRTLVGPLQRTSLAALSASARESRMAVRDTARALGKLGSLVGILILVAGEVAAGPVVRALYGVQYEASATVLRILLAQLAVGTAFFVLGQQLIVLGREGVLQQATVASVGLAVVLGYVLSRHLGPAGIAISLVGAIAFSVSWTAVALASQGSSSGSA